MQVQLNDAVLDFSVKRAEAGVPSVAAISPSTTSPSTISPSTLSPSDAPMRKRSVFWRHPALVLCLSGFAIGCGFWYAMGALDLVAHLFQSKSKSERIASAQSLSATSYESRPTNVGLLTVKLSAERCTTLELDRTTGKSTIAPCPTEVMPLKSLVASRKGDRRIPLAEAKAAATSAAPVAAPAVASWSATVKTATSR
jgi:hypothetical protein